MTGSDIMDLNRQYFEHQLSLMRANGSATRLARTRHLAAAGVTANKISEHQLGIGAAAANGWVSSSQNPVWFPDRSLEVVS